MTPGLTIRISGAGAPLDGEYEVEHEPYGMDRALSPCVFDPVGNGSQVWAISGGVSDDSVADELRGRISVALFLEDGQARGVKLEFGQVPESWEAHYVLLNDGAYEVEVDDRGDTATITARGPAVVYDKVAQYESGSQGPVTVPGPVTFEVVVECDRVGRPGQTPRPDALQARHLIAGAYSAAAQRFNGPATLALAIAIEAGASDADRVAALVHLLELERRFDADLAAIDLSILPSGAGSPVTSAFASLREAGSVTEARLRSLVDDGNPPTAEQVAILLADLRSEGNAAERVRRSIVPENYVFGEFPIKPPQIAASGPVPPPGTVQQNGGSFRIEGPDGQVDLRLENPTTAFASDVSVRVEFEGERTLHLDAVAPGVTYWRFPFPGIGPCQKCETSWKTLDISVAEWRAARPDTVLGR